MRTIALISSLFITLLLQGCGSSSENHKQHELKEVSELKIIESSDNFIDMVLHTAVDDEGEQIYCVNDKTTISIIDTKTGQLSSYYKLTEDEIKRFYKKAVENNPEINFVYKPEELTPKLYTVAIKRLWWEPLTQELFAAINFQFEYEGYLDKEEMTIFGFFLSIVKIESGNIVEEFSLEDVRKVNTRLLTNPEMNSSETQYLSPSAGFCHFNSNFIIKAELNNVSKESNLIGAVNYNQNGLKSQAPLNFNPNPDLHRRKDRISNYYPFVIYNDSLYFSDGKSLFNLNSEEKRTDIVDDKFWSIKEFKFIDDKTVLAFEKCDTSMVHKLFLFDLATKKRSELEKYDERGVNFFFGKLVYRIMKRDDDYYLTTYTIE